MSFWVAFLGGISSPLMSSHLARSKARLERFCAAGSCKLNPGRTSAKPSSSSSRV